MKPWPLALIGFASIACSAYAGQVDPFHDPNIIVPESTRPNQPWLRTAINGRVVFEPQVHTNHLIYVGPPSIPDDGINPLYSMSHGPSRGLFASGYTPSDIRAAYGVPANGGSGAIAVVIAYHYVSALNDFNVFSTTYGLPKETSTSVTSSSNQVFQIVYASGRKPSNNASWAQESALDIEWTHSMAPNAKIYLVEARSSSYTDMFQAVAKANTLAGVTCVSMSWGGGEFSGETTYDSNFTSGRVYFASSGDTGGAISFPACSKNVVGVGGTRLTVSGGAYGGETVWNGAGCGLSAFYSRPTFQDVVSGVVGAQRGSADIGAVADPATGVLVYDSTPSGGVSGWLIFGGTSVACPVCAGIFNTSGSRSASSAAEQSYIYTHAGSFHDITSGSAGAFSGRVGYDLPTGNGSPNGTGSL